jgi:hypothetical protein
MVLSSPDAPGAANASTNADAANINAVRPDIRRSLIAVALMCSPLSVPQSAAMPLAGFPKRHAQAHAPRYAKDPAKSRACRAAPQAPRTSSCAAFASPQVLEPESADLQERSMSRSAHLPFIEMNAHERLLPRAGYARCARTRPKEATMCKNIRTLHNFEPEATDEEIHASALQYVRKISGSTKPSKVNEAAFYEAVDEVAAATQRLLDRLVTTAPPRDREVEAARARARAAKRFATA